MPEVFMRLMEVFSKNGRPAGLTVFVHLAESLIVDQSKSRLETALGVVLRDLRAAGMQVNDK